MVCLLVIGKVGKSVMRGRFSTEFREEGVVGREEGTGQEGRGAQGQRGRVRTAQHSAWGVRWQTSVCWSARAGAVWS